MPIYIDGSAVLTLCFISFAAGLMMNLLFFEERMKRGNKTRTNLKP
jgi:hypothetical protein